ncbi:MAG: lipoyl(octanoyl) transferase LipB [Ignavibacteria bacterium]|nr:lipoyl(octanoyl) transferase LipB [Ignavibacteria bacterium]
MAIAVIDIGRTRYADAWELQRRVFAARTQGAIGDVLMFTEHDHVYTIGKGGDGNHLLASAEEIRSSEIDVVRIDRGGDITYHGPGQIVGYPIIDLTRHGSDIHLYLRKLEEVMIRALARYEITSGREEGMTGVWVKGEKIGAIGVKVSRWTTMHGFAFNVNTDLAYYSRIIPCGIFHKGVTSMERILGRPSVLEEVQTILAECFGEVFGDEMRRRQPFDLEELLKPGAVQLNS